MSSSVTWSAAPRCLLRAAETEARHCMRSRPGRDHRRQTLGGRPAYSTAAGVSASERQAADMAAAAEGCTAPGMAGRRGVQRGRASETRATRTRAQPGPLLFTGSYCSLLNFAGLSPNRTQSGRNPIGQQHLSGEKDG